MLVLTTFVLLILLIAIGMPVGFTMGIAGLVGLILFSGFDTTITYLSQISFSSVASPTLATVPLFILMGELVSSGGVAKDLFNAVQKFLGRIPGGVAITTVFTSAAFGSMSGSTTAAAGALSRITMPEFRRLGYEPGLASGVVAVSGTLAILIPPSIPMIIYGVATQTSIGKLLLAGLIPGIVTAVVYIIGIIFWNKMKPGIMPKGEKYTWKEKFSSLKNLWGFAIIVGFILYALYGGIATPTEVAALGSLFALVFLLMMRRLNWKSFSLALQRTLTSTAMIFVIIIGANIYAKFITLTNVARNLLEWLTQLNIGPWGIMCILIVLYLLLGCVMDQIAILVITLPITFPLVMSFGFSPIWFGVIVIKLVEIGLVTPPVGMNSFIVSGAAGVPLEKVFKGTGMMLSFEALTLIILLAFPIITTVLVQ
ncbi:TRAP transporter large permease [Bacillus sp. EB600]|uniref:TRAP transporter large permease n=1 Tax=Bacillus sp. EB600 TaxID=2806345 RepID=UPI0021090671|nr:TRAP transporter large permease [Bacillus sp. EB600]MCQ6279575.1 TRAP transporter large permease [Bacillus sp. EB600]